MSPVSGKKLTKSEKSNLASLRFGELVQGHGASQKKKEPKKTPIALFRVSLEKSTLMARRGMVDDGHVRARPAKKTR